MNAGLVWSVSGIQHLKRSCDVGSEGIVTSSLLAVRMRHGRLT